MKKVVWNGRLEIKATNKMVLFPPEVAGNIDAEYGCLLRTWGMGRGTGAEKRLMQTPGWIAILTVGCQRNGGVGVRMEKGDNDASPHQLVTQVARRVCWCWFAMA